MASKHHSPLFRGGTGAKLRSKSGFSLIEVVLAIGIISFALVALLGVTMVGTNAGRESKNDTDYGYVFEQVAGQLRTKPFAQTQKATEDDPRLFPLPPLDRNTTSPTVFYLDDQNLVAPEERANKRVAIGVFDPLQLSEANAPKTGAAYPYRNHLAYVNVEISRIPASSDKTETSIYFTEICPLQQ